jgi:Secretion system C-terminal sorting domain
MLRRATVFMTMVAAILLVKPAFGQAPVDVTIAQINAIPQAQIDLLDAGGANLTSAEINSGSCAGLIYDNTLCTQNVRITAVVMSDPLNSGLSNLGSDGTPDRIHVFVRDVASDISGPDGMGIQIVDGSALGFDTLIRGDVITVVGTISPFFTTMQINPESFQVVGSRDTATDPIFNPIMVTSADINKSVGADGAVQVNWSRFSALRGNFVRLENAEVLTRTIGSRSDFNISNDGGTTSLAFYDTSIRFRNDRADYPDKFNKHTEDFIPPPPGSRVNLQGFLTYPGQTGSDPFGLAVPSGHILAINPMADSDLEVTQSPPVMTVPSHPAFVPGAAPVDITVDIQADPSRTLTSTVLKYNTSSDATVQSVSASSTSGDTFTFQIPVVSDKDFVEYWVEATDSQSATSTTDKQSYRVLQGGIQSISDIQLTFNAGAGQSPFKGVTDFMNINATVMTDFAASGFMSIQDDPGLAPWTGILMEATDAVKALNLKPGDQIRITNGTVGEVRFPNRYDRSDVNTGIGNPTVAVSSRGGAPLDYKVITTDVLQDPDISEGFESMMLRFEGVTIVTSQADGTRDFGEFRVGTTGTDPIGVRVDDASKEFPGTFNDGLIDGQGIDFIQGIWTTTFGRNKLEPESLSDVGTITDTETEELPAAFELHQNYPNPFNPVTTINFDVAQTGHINLEVFDMLGRRVATLVDAERAVGTYSVVFNARNLTSGVYVYRIRSQSRTQVKSMLLLK